MRVIIVTILLLGISFVNAQELYVFSEPASNMPAHSISVKETVKGLHDEKVGRNESRYTTEVMFGFNKNFMLHAATGFSDMYSGGMRWESAKLYAKYRVFSNDDLYSHLRISLFGEASYSRNIPVYNELSMDGDQTGVQAGIIVTQLLHKLAISSTISVAEVLQPQRWEKSFPQIYPFSAVNYSLSAGYLVLPKTYKSYDQTNLNLYVELLGQNTTDIKYYFVDLAPAAQLIFNSQSKLSLGYRFQLNSDMYRMAKSSWLLSFEWLFLNAMKK